MPRPLKSLLLYAVLVGVPFVGLLAILRAGSRLHAPPYVGGAWTVAPGAAPHPACAAPLEELRRAGMQVSQSGVHLDVAVRLEREERLPGRLEDGAVRAARTRVSPVSVPPRSVCDPAEALRLDARLEAAGRMAGTLTLGRTAVPFTAERAPVPARRGRGGH